MAGGLGGQPRPGGVRPRASWRPGLETGAGAALHPGRYPGYHNIYNIYNIPTQAHCQQGELLVPDNFQADTLPCPALHSCVAWPRPADTARLANLVNPLQLEYIKAMVCGGEGEELACAPATNEESLFSAENLLQSLVAPPPACRPNPCPGGATPTLSEDGYYRCVSVVQHLSTLDSLATQERRCRRFEVRRACPDCPGGTRCVPRFRFNFRFNFKRSG